jgi:DedD protein
MAEKSSAAEPKAMPPELKRKLAWRMAIAGSMIVVLLGALALFDRINAPDEEDDTPRFTAPVPTAKTEVTQPVTSTPIADAAPANNSQDNAPEKPAEPEASAAPVAPVAAEKPARPDVAAQPGLPRSAGAHGAPAASEKTARSNAMPASTPASTPAAAAAGRSPAAPAAASVGGSAGIAAATASQPQASAVPPPRLANGYALQAGVFADLRRAEELHALLTLNGIPSTLEARVQAGPFRTRAEADAARDKLKSLGVDSVLLPPPKSAARR